MRRGYNSAAGTKLWWKTNDARLLCVCAEEGDEEILDEPVMEYHAGENRVGRYVIRSCIGGHESAFVASGSEVKSPSPSFLIAAPAAKRLLVTHAHDRDNIRSAGTEALKHGEVAFLEQCWWGGGCLKQTVACILHHTTSLGPERMRRRRHCQGFRA